MNPLRALARAGLLRPFRPDHFLRAGLLVRRWGTTPAAGVAVAALRCPDQAAVVDEGDELTYAELHRRTDTLAAGLADCGAGAKLLLMDGEPIAEPVVGHGPFVMNSRAEIQQAFEDYQLGRMGELAER